MTIKNIMNAHKKNFKCNRKWQNEVFFPNSQKQSVLIVCVQFI